MLSRSALKGGAAAHMLHGNGFGDLDFYIYQTQTNLHDELGMVSARASLGIGTPRSSKSPLD